MGYRYQLISDTMVPKKEELPEWFLTKYNGHIDFDREFWVSRDEYKGYLELHEDIKRLLKVVNLNQIQLVYFADEGLLLDESQPDITHVLITEDSIKTLVVLNNNWTEIK